MTSTAGAGVATWEGIEPFYFGAPAEALFGCYYPANPSVARDEAVLLCPPMGWEYGASLRAYRHLAVRLRGAGFAVMRFDYYGCGDSSGDSPEARVDRWVADASMAIDEIRARASVSKTSLVGFRMGASVAMSAGAQRGDVDSLALWDPVIEGKGYLEELSARQEYLVQELGTARQEPPVDGYSEVFGFLFSTSMLSDIEHLDLTRVVGPPANRVLLIGSGEQPDHGRLEEHLKRAGVQVDAQHIPTKINWIAEPYKALVPDRVLQAIVSWLSEADR